MGCREKVCDECAKKRCEVGKSTLMPGASNCESCNFSAARRFITTGIQDFTRGVICGDYSPPREWCATAGLKY